MGSSLRWSQLRTCMDICGLHWQCHALAIWSAVDEVVAQEAAAGRPACAARASPLMAGTHGRYAMA
jgi:hypothetical protein